VVYWVIAKVLASAPVVGSKPVIVSSALGRSKAAASPQRRAMRRPIVIAIAPEHAWRSSATSVERLPVAGPLDARCPRR
jgi:hypothetical protein